MIDLIIYTIAKKNTITRYKIIRFYDKIILSIKEFFMIFYMRIREFGKEKNYARK